MEPASSRHRLRSYLVAAFLPLAMLPLFVIAGLTYYFVDRAVSQEISRRAAPELAAISRNLETLERRNSRVLLNLARWEEVKLSLLREDENDLEQLLEQWIPDTPLEYVRVYGTNGQLKTTYTRHDGARLLQEWKTLFNTRQPSSLEEAPLPKITRTPSSDSSFQSDQSRHEKSGALKKHFLRHLRHEDNWSVRDFDAARGNVRLNAYKILTDTESRPLAYLEAGVTLDESKLKILAAAQGIDLAVISPQSQLLASSSGEVTRALMGALSGWVERKTSVDLRSTSREVEISGQPVEFFFAPLANENGPPVAWIGVGLSKESQAEFRRTIFVWMTGLVFLMSGLIIYLTFAISRWITRPVSDLVRAVELMQAGEWVQPIASDSKTEVGYLVKRFNEMALSVQVTKRTLETKLEELAEAHEALTRTQGQLIQSAKMSSLGQLVAGVAHELNNPIAFIYSNMSQMREYLKQLETLDHTLQDLKPDLTQKSRQDLEHTLENIEWDYVRKDMDEIVKSCLEGSVRVKDIVLGLRNFSRLDQGQFADADLHSALRNTVKLLSSQIKNRVTVHWDLCADGMVLCNLSQINQVFMNLLANGLQAINGPGDIWIHTSFEADSDMLAIHIRDSGRGIAPEHLDKIFDPFFTTKKVGDGTGLGLSIVYGIIQRHQGSIEVKSQLDPHPDHGTEFIVRLPRKSLATRGGSHSTRQAS